MHRNVLQTVLGVGGWDVLPPPHITSSHGAVHKSMLELRFKAINVKRVSAPEPPEGQSIGDLADEHVSSRPGRVVARGHEPLCIEGTVRLYASVGSRLCGGIANKYSGKCSGSGT